MRLTHYCRSNFSALLLFLTLVIFALSSCISTKNTVYFKDLKEDTTLTNLVSRPPEVVIRPGDLLSITVASLSPETATMYNAAPNSENGLLGYLVDKDGNIDFFKLGKVKVEGLTKTQLSQQLQVALEPYLAQNKVTVGVQNRHVTMMGAVSPKILPLTENMTLLDAIAASGDVGEKGKADNILVIREKDAGREKTFKRLNLTDKSIFYSPYFYLQPNDVVYVEPAPKKATVISVISIVVSTTSFVLLIIDRIFR